MRHGLIAAAALLVLGHGPALAQQATTTRLADAAGKDVGTVTLTPAKDGLLLRAELKGLPPGVHGFHIHAVGKCEPPFQSAGPHFSPETRKHGYHVESGPHAGDLPNLHVGEGGSVTAEMMVPEVTLASGGKHSLVDADGSSIVVHEKADDYKTDPAGDSGGRIACGVIAKPAS
jgi:Cu-Zn family superoxide dismutase